MTLTINVSLGMLLPVLCGCQILGTHQQTASELEPSCDDYYQTSLHNPDRFVGFGSASTQDAAVDAARMDLAKQIRTKVTGVGRVEESNKSVDTDVIYTSAVSELLIGAMVARHCPTAPNRYEAVVFLPKNRLTSNLENHLQQDLQQAANLHKAITEAKGGAEELAQIISARQFLKERESEDWQNYDLCKSFSGCAQIDLASLRTLSDSMNGKYAKDQFKLETTGDDATHFRGKLIGLLQNDGIIIADAPADQKRLGKAECQRTVFPKAAGLDDQIVELNCRVNGSIDGVLAFTYTYSGKGAGENPDAATLMAGNLLKRAQ